jgi:hypothetical protein
MDHSHRKEAIMKSKIGNTVFLFVLLAFAAVSPAQDFFAVLRKRCKNALPENVLTFDALL